MGSSGQRLVVVAEFPSPTVCFKTQKVFVSLPRHHPTAVKKDNEDPVECGRAGLVGLLGCRRGRAESGLGHRFRKRTRRQGQKGEQKVPQASGSRRLPERSLRGKTGQRKRKNL